MRRHNFKKMQIWQEAIDLVNSNYQFTASLPDFEKFGLRSQMNRCAVSIASNIAEGSSKSSNKHFIKYLEDGLGSAFEWETQILICQKQNFISNERFFELEEMVQKLQRKISNFINSLDKD